MVGMDYDDATAERLEAVYLGADVVNQRKETRRCLGLRPGDSVIDVGSGPGFLAQEMAEEVGSGGRVCGVDISSDMIRRADARNQKSWVSYHEADATALPFDDESFDVMVSTQVAEYVPDVMAFCRETFRVMKAGGRGLLVATDWGTVAWHSDVPERMARMLSAFRPHCAHSELPRTFAPILRAAGFAVDAVTVYPIVNIDWSDENYSKNSAAFIAAYVRAQGKVAEAEITAWEQEFPDLAADGRYYFSTSRTLFHVTKPAAPA